MAINVGHPESSDRLEKVLSATLRSVFENVARDPMESTNTILMGSDAPLSSGKLIEARRPARPRPEEHGAAGRLAAAARPARRRGLHRRPRAGGVARRRVARAIRRGRLSRLSTARAPSNGRSWAAATGRPAPGRNPQRIAARASADAASRSSGRVWEAITARRSRAVPSGTVGGSTASQNTPSSTAASTIRCASSASPTTSGTMCESLPVDVEALAGQPVAQRRGVVAQALHPPRLLLEQVQRRHRGGDRDGRRRRRVDAACGRC